MEADGGLAKIGVVAGANHHNSRNVEKVVIIGETHREDFMSEKIDRISMMIEDSMAEFEERFFRCQWIPQDKVEQSEMDIVQLILTWRIWKLLNSPVSTPKVKKEKEKAMSNGDQSQQSMEMPR